MQFLTDDPFRSSAHWSEGPWFGFDLETTGADPRVDLPVQIAVVKMDSFGNVEKDVFLVKPGIAVSDGARSVHKITDAQIEAEGIELSDAANRLHSLLSVPIANGLPIVAMNAYFDVTISERIFDIAGVAKLNWKNIIDPLILDRKYEKFRKGSRKLKDLCLYYKVSTGELHQALDDSIATLLLTKQIILKYPEISEFTIENLFEMQQQWHHEWAIDFDKWKQSKGYEGLTKYDFKWPVAL
ncbi:MAG: hypothetical protein HKL80_05165 [Acidimicrobiales bacterium]|nr:hypothetical protein [Acidimicrobiales bacterium]